VEAGAQSQIAQFATAAVVTLVLIFLTGPLQYLPRCVLGALVFLVAVHLIDLRSLRSMRNESPGEFALALTTTAIVVGAGVEQGILGAMVISLLRIVAHSYHPHSGVLIHDANGSWKTIPVVAGAKTEPGLVLYRFGAALFYANAGRFAEEVRCLVGPAPSSVRWLVVDAEAITGIDYSAARVVIELQESLSKGGVDLCFARLRWDTRSDFDRHHLTEVVGTSHIFDKIHDALNAFAKLPISS
jgi:sulfate permease, SulP family